ncbi:hypothetical protein ARMSODRAFT_958326 [Armillaria solidipes]|uniref:Uncharacterized protein n=1 Tax=Armillaria solidipes TaxID=1076256 RepID=A0A2H3BGY0_9AGAR|nr:hypothetical protein ARMSODRAFT_958326 [Armillaria solidipes]
MQPERRAGCRLYKQTFWKAVYASDIFRNIKGFLTANAEFVYNLTTDETGVASIELMAQWMRTVKECR